MKSYEVKEFMLEQLYLASNELLIFAYIYSLTKNGQYVDITTGTIKEATGIKSRTTIVTTLNSLISKKYISKYSYVRGKGTYCKYKTLVFDEEEIFNKSNELQDKKKERIDKIGYIPVTKGIQSISQRNDILFDIVGGSNNFDIDDIEKTKIFLKAYDYIACKNYNQNETIISKSKAKDFLCKISDLNLDIEEWEYIIELWCEDIPKMIVNGKSPTIWLLLNNNMLDIYKKRANIYSY